MIGLLNHAAKVVRPGRPFLRNLINASMSVRSLDHRVHLSAAARQDLAWWSIFLSGWNGICVMPPPEPSHHLISDASGSWGHGAIWANQWLQQSWPADWAEVSIAPKELVPIVMAVALWGQQWAGTRVRIHCDNMAVVHAINKKSARDILLSKLLRILCLFCAVYDTHLVAQHITGAANTSADALSRNNIYAFFALNPQASPVPTVVPRPLREFLLSQRINSSSKTWTKQWKATLESVSLPPHGLLTTQHSAAT